MFRNHRVSEAPDTIQGDRLTKAAEPIIGSAAFVFLQYPCTTE